MVRLESHKTKNKRGEIKKMYYYVIAKYWEADELSRGGAELIESIIYKTTTKKQAEQYLSRLLNKKAVYGKTYQKNYIKLRIFKSKEKFRVDPYEKDSIEWRIKSKW